MTQQNKIIEVETGQVKAAKSPARLRASALGSCIAVILYDGEHRIGGIAHVMLPSVDIYIKGDDLLKYAEYAIEDLIYKITKEHESAKALEQENSANAKRCILKAKLVGGAMIVEDSINIGKQNIKAVEERLKREGVEVISRKEGGHERRSVTLDLDTGAVWVSEGGGVEHAL